jgi:hypothetical protein
MTTKNQPGPYDCYAKAEPDEPMFVLLARDKRAPIMVRMWATSSQQTMSEAKFKEALACADAMEHWYYHNRQGHCKRDPSPVVGACGGTKSTCSCECLNCKPEAP